MRRTSSAISARSPPASRSFPAPTAALISSSAPRTSFGLIRLPIGCRWRDGSCARTTPVCWRTFAHTPSGASAPSIRLLHNHCDRLVQAHIAHRIGNLDTLALEGVPQREQHLATDIADALDRIADPEPQR